MKKALFLTTFLLATQSVSFAGVTKSYDHQNACSLYRVQNKEKNKEGNYVYPELKDGEKIINDTDAYNMKLHDMRIDADGGQIVANLRINKILGRNKDLIKKVSIRFENGHADKLLNFYFDQVCIDGDNQIIYANQYSRKDF